MYCGLYHWFSWPALLITGILIALSGWGQDQIYAEFLHKDEVGMSLIDRRFRDTLFNTFHQVSLKKPRLLSVTLKPLPGWFHGSLGFPVGVVAVEFTFRDQPVSPKSSFVKITTQIEQMPGMDGGPRYFLSLKTVGVTPGKIKNLQPLLPASHLMAVDADMVSVLIDPEFEALTQEALESYYYRGGQDLAIYGITQSHLLADPLAPLSPKHGVRYQIEVGTPVNLRPELTLIFKLTHLPDGDSAIGKIQDFVSQGNLIDIKPGKEGDELRRRPVITPTYIHLNEALSQEPRDDGFSLSPLELKVLSYRFAKTLLEIMQVHQEAQRSLPLNMALRFTAKLLGFSETTQAKLFADPKFRGSLAPFIPAARVSEVSTSTFQALMKHIPGGCSPK